MKEVELSIYIQVYLVIGAVLAAYIVWDAYHQKGGETDLSGLEKPLIILVLGAAWLVILLLWPITVYFKTRASFSRN